MTNNRLYWDSAFLANEYGNNVALIEMVDETAHTISYTELHQLVLVAKEQLSNYLCSAKKQLIMLVAINDINSIVYYLAGLQLRHVIWWIDKDCSLERMQQLQTHYGVNLMIKEGKISRLNRDDMPLHDDLALLITTSGSTGSPTLVRLSYQNLNSNSLAIKQALALQTDDMAVTTLPLQYSFGLSIINSHLAAGSCIVLTESTLMSRDFWSLFKFFDIKCLYGVPHTFDMLLKLTLARLPLKKLRFMAVAGGKLSPEKVSQVNDYCLEHNGQFFVMYGQTEATARITVLSASKTQDKPFSIGDAIAGRLWIEDEQGQKIIHCNKRGELCYQGDNVMMGLAKVATDLQFSQETPILRTGDLAIQDKDGDFQIVGRLKRMIKVVGHRINLDDIECFFSEKGLQVACTGQDDLIFCYLIADGVSGRLQKCQEILAEYLSIHSSYLQWFTVAEFPHLASGKLNYQLLDTLRLAGELS